MEGRIRAAKRRFDEAISLAWHVEAFARTKRLPQLSKVLGGEEKQTVKVQAGPEIVEAMRAWVRHTTVQ